MRRSGIDHSRGSGYSYHMLYWHARDLRGKNGGAGRLTPPGSPTWLWRVPVCDVECGGVPVWMIKQRRAGGG
jgi:hypothetical protein